MAAHSKRLGDLLLDANLIDEIQLRVALQEQETTGERLGSALVHLGFIDETTLAAFLSKQANLPCVNILGLHIAEEIIALVPRDIAVEHSVIPIRRSGDILYLAMADPFDQKALDAVEQLTSLSVMPLIAPEFRLRKSIEKYYGVPSKIPEPSSPVDEELQSVVSEVNEDFFTLVLSRLEMLSAKIEALAETVARIEAKLK